MIDIIKINFELHFTYRFYNRNVQQIKTVKTQNVREQKKVINFFTSKLYGPRSVVKTMCLVACNTKQFTEFSCLVTAYFL